MTPFFMPQLPEVPMTSQPSRSGTRGRQGGSACKGLATKPSDLNLIPGTHMVVDKTDTYELSPDLSLRVLVHGAQTRAEAHACTVNK